MKKKRKYTTKEFRKVVKCQVCKRGMIEGVECNNCKRIRDKNV